MKLQPTEFRRHVDNMISENKKEQLEMWIGHGLLIYSNFSELRDIWDEEYEEKLHELG
jgi:hypothetical protein